MAEPGLVDALALAVEAAVPVLLWGAPGTGKTSVVRALADVRACPCEVVIASIREPSDFAGLPLMANGGVRFAPPTWAQRLASDGGDGLLFLDEISTAPPAVQAALLRVVLERVVGDLALPDAVRVIAAANPPEQAADGWDLSAPLANRFCHLDWSVSASSVADGFAGGFPAPPRIDLPAGWHRHVTVARGLVATFITARPNLVCEPPGDAARAGRGWPSPRTWEMAATLWGAAESIAMPAIVRALLVRGAVGDGAAIEFLSWVDEMDLPDPEAVLADPSSFVVPDRADRVYAVLTAVAAIVAATPTPERWAAGWQVLARAVGETPDAAATAARVLARCRPAGAPLPPEMLKFVPILHDAGLLERE